MKKEEYLNIVTEQIRCRAARGAVREEMENHIADQMEAFAAEGMEPREAEAAAVREMGDPVTAGNELDRIHRPKMDWKMIGLIGFLGIVGLALQNLMQQHFGESEVGIQPGRQLIWLLRGFGVMILVCYLDYSRIAYWAKGCMLAIFALALYTIAFGLEVNGTRQWIHIARISINIKMLLLLLVPLYGAVLYSWRGQGYRAIGKAVLLMLPGMFFAWRMPSVLTVLLLFLSFTILLTLAVGKGWFRVAKKPLLAGIWSVVLLLPIAGVAAVLLMGAGYQRERVLALLGRGEGVSFQARMIKELLAGSRLMGAGELPPADHLSYLSDYTLAYAISYYGILAAALLMGMIAFLLFRLLRISLKQKNSLGMIMGAGSATVLVLQVLFYLLVNLGGIPMGNYCPFLSYGGSGMLVTYILLGLLLSIYRYENVIAESSIRLSRKARKPAL